MLRDIYAGVAKLEEASVVIASNLPGKQKPAASLKAKAAASAEVAAAVFSTGLSHAIADERRTRSAASTGGGGPPSSYSHKSTALIGFSKPLDPRNRSAPSARCSPARGGGMKATAAAKTTSTTTITFLSNDPWPLDPRNKAVLPMEWNCLWEGEGGINQGVDALRTGPGFDGDQALTMITIGDGVERCRVAACGGQEGKGRSTAEGVSNSSGAHTGKRGGGVVERKVGAMESGEASQQQQEMLKCAMPIAVKQVSLPAWRATQRQCSLVGIIDMMEPPSGKRCGEISSPRFSKAHGFSPTRQEDTAGGEAQDPASSHEELNCSIDLHGAVWHADRCLLRSNTGTVATTTARTWTATNSGRQGTSRTNNRPLGGRGIFAGKRDDGAGGLDGGARNLPETPRHVGDSGSHGQLNNLRGSVLQSDPGWVEADTGERLPVDKCVLMSIVFDRDVTICKCEDERAGCRYPIATIDRCIVWFELQLNIVYWGGDRVLGKGKVGD